MKLLSQRDISALHKKYAPSKEVLKTNYTHCQIVRDIALEIAKTFPKKLDKDLIVTGALLHDIGYYPILKADGNLKPGHMTIEHGVIGEKILKNEDLPIEISRIASHHTGAGISLRQIIERNLPLPHADYLAETDEEKLIMYADKFHSKHGGEGVFNTHSWYKQYASQFGEETSLSFTELTDLFGIPNLTKIHEKYGHRVRGK